MASRFWYGQGGGNNGAQVMEKFRDRAPELLREILKEDRLDKEIMKLVRGEEKQAVG
ncbi:MAG: hypothetical protein KAV43_02070 [Hadesarchaea archaeon]|nr:hypothetical protein [Hadesarchaea archaeon]